MALVRGGWLWRQSSILRRWKRNWFALWLDGTLGYYHDETAQDEEDRVLIHFNVRDIKIGQECHDVQPPEGRSRDGLLTVNLREGGRLHLCAETRDDAMAWKTALLEANSTPVRVYSPYQDYYEVVPPNAHEATYVRSYYGPTYVPGPHGLSLRRPRRDARSGPGGSLLQRGRPSGHEHACGSRHRCSTRLAHVVALLVLSPGPCA
ncbi:pleckstrin homology domain-containing family B member 1 isoform X1 [Physeter macrocephalus]|uniref:Pleckstrin homology domain-containing family B member 1 isoform X1 n=1 Tax=Physeter macrocephalus TaxID=9755 RepID=A0A455AD18_PHYMC|nr:pleckstrin homology domain-containing family B member 1 isoform X1 [Physeter catodon]|eukprot:XP_028333149.1 pleckstrin homology domain-containing family B member 1 isoform X1 [Physeter catodon]